MIILKNFQQEAVDSAVELFLGVAEMLDTAIDKTSRQLALQHNGALLIEAPTGAGKTLIAGHIAEKLSKQRKTVWFWFSPFVGLVEQSEGVIRKEFQSLRPRDLSSDRIVESTHSGDVFVTTWASVATNNKETRKARSNGESFPSVDTLVSALKLEGFRIGVIVDEAHHSFNKGRQALEFYKDVLAPDFTILVTATPKDKEIERFKEEVGFLELHRITISRQDCVDANLIKKGIRAVVFKADESQSNLIDFEYTALRHGTEAHRKILSSLQEMNIDLTPLMLVQVDSRENSVQEAQAKLKALGFRDDEIAIHTAAEPDPDIISLAYDESKQVLIFKMAVALGFDAPRAFTLVSMRKSRDVDFGVQVVGRILRVERRLQILDLPDSLKYGYVFLADYGAQTGLTSAAERINAIRTQLTEVSTNIALVSIGEQGKVGQLLRNGQATLSLDFIHPPISDNSQPEEPYKQETQNTEQIPLLDFLMPQTVLEDDPTRSAAKGSSYIPPIRLDQKFEYELRDDISFPKVFQKEVYPLDFREITQTIASHFRMDAEVLAVTRRTSTKALRKEIELFEPGKETVTDTYAALSDSAIAKKAQLSLFDADQMVINSRELYSQLKERLKKEFLAQGWDDMLEEQALRRGLDLILANYPHLIKKAVRECLANFAELEDTAPLPQTLESDSPLPSSRLNLYRVKPNSLNGWESEFADMMDNDTSGTVLWWHRNDVRKPWAVSLVVPGFNDFYPDFVVGVKDRRKGNGILLVETKREFNNARGDSVAKVRAEHKVYWQVMMLYWENEKRWYTIKYDEANDKSIMDNVFRFELMKDF